jgi:DNA-binding beta-propeller fold protein YncE
VVNADGSGLHQIPVPAGTLFTLFLSPDEKTIYVTEFDPGTSVPILWKMNADGSNPEKVVTDCGQVEDVSPDQQFLIGVVWSGERTGILQYSVADQKCTQLVSGVTTFNAAFAPDYKSILYANPSQRETTVVRVPWSNGKLTGPPQTALTMPFAFPFSSGGNAYDFAHDLSTIAFALPSSHADLYLLSSK